MIVVTVSLRVMVVLIIIRDGEWELPSECMHFSVVVGYSNSNSNTIINKVMDPSEIVRKKDWTGQEMASILSIGIIAFLAIFSGTLTS